MEDSGGGGRVEQHVVHAPKQANVVVEDDNLAELCEGECRDLVEGEAVPLGGPCGRRHHRTRQQPHTDRLQLRLTARIAVASDDGVNRQQCACCGRADMCSVGVKGSVTDGWANSHRPTVQCA